MKDHTTATEKNLVEITYGMENGEINPSALAEKLCRVEQALLTLAYRLENIAGGKIQEEIFRDLNK